MNALTETDIYGDATARGSFTQIPVIDLSPLSGTDVRAITALAVPIPPNVNADSRPS
jgi:hypothetical protein